jgi:hypothetical protein
MRSSFVFAAAVLGVASLASAQNLLADPSLEAPLTYDGPPFIGSWEGFQGNGPTASSANSTVMPRSGAGHVALSILGDDNAFAGLFQDVLVAPGSMVTFSGFHMTPSSVNGVATEFRIEWRDATNEVGRTPNSTTSPGSAYSQFSLSALVPANADRGRFVYAIQTFGGEPNPGNNGVVYLDDMSVVVPEPTTLALIAPVAVGLLRRSRR